jgi:hypothetical protein
MVSVTRVDECHWKQFMVIAQREEGMSTTPSPDFTPQARRRWDKVPQWARERILESVWCGNCLTGTPIDFCVGRMEGECLVLEGTCKLCGHDVVRLIEPEE